MRKTFIPGFHALLVCIICHSCKKKNTDTNSATSNPSTDTYTYIDVHCHLQGVYGANQFDFEGAADEAIEYMDDLKIKKLLVMPPPFSNQSSQNGIRYDIDNMSAALQKYPDRFAFLGGGKYLNVMIQDQVTNKATINVDSFKTKARELAQMEGFVGFGEIATQHFCMGDGHVYEQANPDNTLFMALVDVAAEYDVPIDLHQEAIPTDMAFPSLTTSGCDDNPDSLGANISQFCSLLSYAQSKNVTIIWDHVGWDNTKQWTSSLCDSLLTLYSNLYFSIKVSPNDSPEDNRIVDTNGNLKTEWLNLFLTFPDHFMIGADQFFITPLSSSGFPPSIDETWDIVNQLPDNLKAKIAYENANTIFKLN